MSFLSGCPHGGSRQTHTDFTERVRIKGDPMAFVSGTRRNGNAPLPAALLADGSKWSFNSYGFFEEPAQSRQAGATNKASGEAPPDAGTRPNFARVEVKDGRVALIVNERGEESFFYFLRTGDEVKFQGIGETKGVEDLQLLHTSYRPDLTLFSLLFAFKARGQRILIAYYFSAAGAGPGLIKTSLPYRYIYGVGVKMGWVKDKPLSLSICAPPDEQTTLAAQDGVSRWAKALDGRLALTSRVEASCLPFSDVNGRTLNFVQPWVEIVGRDMLLGITFNIPELRQGTFADGDIFMYPEEVAESGTQDWKRMVSRPEGRVLADWAMTHEIGHLLGLHHQFDGTSSVMSYNDKEGSHLKAYDVNAIQALYAP